MVRVDLQETSLIIKQGLFQNKCRHGGYHGIMATIVVDLYFVSEVSPEQNGRHFADNIFRCIFMNKKCYIAIRISLKFVPKGHIDNKSALVQVMAWRRTGDKPLPEAMLTQFNEAYLRH